MAAMVGQETGSKQRVGSCGFQLHLGTRSARSSTPKKRQPRQLSSARAAETPKDPSPSKRLAELLWPPTDTEDTENHDTKKHMFRKGEIQTGFSGLKKKELPSNETWQWKTNYGSYILSCFSLMLPIKPPFISGFPLPLWAPLRGNATAWRRPGHTSAQHRCCHSWCSKMWDALHLQRISRISQEKHVDFFSKKDGRLANSTQVEDDLEVCW